MTTIIQNVKDFPSDIRPRKLDIDWHDIYTRLRNEKIVRVDIEGSGARNENHLRNSIRGAMLSRGMRIEVTKHDGGMFVRIKQTSTQ